MKTVISLLITVSLTGCAQYAQMVDNADLCHPKNEARRAELKLNCGPSRTTTVYVRKGYLPNTYTITH